jgi:hypothetical protein
MEKIHRLVFQDGNFIDEQEFQRALKRMHLDVSPETEKELLVA